MPETYVQVSPNSSGEKIRNRQRTVGANVVDEQMIGLAADDSYTVFASAIAFAANKHHLSIFNGSGSGKILRLRKLFCINESLAAVTGVAVQFKVFKTTAQSAGTTITPVTHDTNNGAIPAQILFGTGCTITNGSLLWTITRSNDEIGATGAFPESPIFQGTNLIPAGNENQEYVLRETQGITVQQITSTVIGSFSWFAVVTLDP